MQCTSALGGRSVASDQQ